MPLSATHNGSATRQAIIAVTDPLTSLKPPAGPEIFDTPRLIKRATYKRTPGQDSSNNAETFGAKRITRPESFSNLLPLLLLLDLSFFFFYFSLAHNSAHTRFACLDQLLAAATCYFLGALDAFLVDYHLCSPNTLRLEIILHPEIAKIFYASLEVVGRAVQNDLADRREERNALQFAQVDEVDGGEHRFVTNFHNSANHPGFQVNVDNMAGAVGRDCFGQKKEALHFHIQTGLFFYLSHAAFEEGFAIF
jgi:hypothetical protein